MQTARKNAGLEVEDRIELALDGDPALLRASEAHRDYIAGETLAVELNLADGAIVPASEWGHSDQLQIEGLGLTISLRKA